MLNRDSDLFGSANRTAVLVAIRLLGSTYPAELAAMLSLRLWTVQRIIDSYEREGVILSRAVGRTRTVSLNARGPAAKELSALLWAMGKADVALQTKLASRRRRRRRPGKQGVA